MPNNIRITDHAYQRMKERMGLNKKAAKRMMSIVYKSGICKDNTTGQLSKYLEARDESYEREGNRVLIYGEMVYCFADYKDVSVLVKVYRVPNHLRNHATYQTKKVKAA